MLNSTQQNQKFLEQYPDWKLEGDRLMLRKDFGDFKKAMNFVNKVAEIAEQHQHHPNIEVVYSRVNLELYSHDAGGLTAKDLELAKAVSESALDNNFKTIL